MTKTRTLEIGLLTIAMTGALALPAMAVPANMRVVGKANPPIGHYEFCKTYGAE